VNYVREVMFIRGWFWVWFIRERKARTISGLYWERTCNVVSVSVKNIYFPLYKMHMKVFYKL